MDSKEFSKIRLHLGKTQKEMSQLLGASLKAVQSFEQGWRKITPQTERHVLFLLTRKRGKRSGKACWVQLKCPAERRKRCPAWEFNCGTLCWFVSGTVCKGEVQMSWEKKMKLCRKCKVFKELCPSI